MALQGPGLSLAGMLRAGAFLRVIEAHDGLSGLIAERTRVQLPGEVRSFDALWVSSLCDSVTRGKPDIELVDFSSRLNNVNDLMEVSTKPILFDGDTGGRPEHLAHHVRTLQRMGVAGLVIEDKRGLKRNSLLCSARQELEPIEHFCAKLEAACGARGSADFLLVARVESLIAGRDVGDALARADAYCRAGADGIMIHTRNRTGADIQQFAGEFRQRHPLAPLAVAPTAYPQVTEAELARWGVSMVIYANQLLRSAFRAMTAAAQGILRDGSAAGQSGAPMAELLAYIPGMAEEELPR